jgi:hypothetical protein
VGGIEDESVVGKRRGQAGARKVGIEKGWQGTHIRGKPRKGPEVRTRRRHHYQADQEKVVGKLSSMSKYDYIRASMGEDRRVRRRQDRCYEDGRVTRNHSRNIH